MKITDPTIPLNANNFYGYTFSHFEPWSLVAMAAFFIGLCLYSIKTDGEFSRIPKVLASRRLALYVAVGVLLFAAVGRFYIYDNFDLCVDEYLNEFEAQILQQHYIVAPVPMEWVTEVHAMSVPFQIYHGTASEGYWVSGFLPGSAFLNAVFDTFDLGWALSPILAGLSIVLLASLARRAFPEEAILASNSAVLLLACTPQFLIMSLTKFAWPAHLCGTLLWVWLFTHPNRWLFLLTPILGVFLIGLHQPHVHFLVAAPFLLRLLYTFRWKAMLWFGIWYAGGLWMWFHVYVMLRPIITGAGGDLGNLGFPVLVSIYIAVCHFITFYAWMTPILLPFVLIALITWRLQPPLVQDSILASAITFLFYLSFPHFQGHGWGYRFVHPAYGLMALAGAGGLIAWRHLYKSPLAVKALLFSVIFSLVIQIPYRIYEVRTMVPPLARAWAYIASRPCDFVIIKTSEFWYSCDLIRNDPWLKRKPFVFSAESLTDGQKADLASKGRVLVIGADEVRDTGVILSDPAKKL